MATYSATSRRSFTNIPGASENNPQNITSSTKILRQSSYRSYDDDTLSFHSARSGSEHAIDTSLTNLSLNSSFNNSLNRLPNNNNISSLQVKVLEQRQTQNTTAASPNSDNNSTKFNSSVPFTRSAVKPVASSTPRVLPKNTVTRPKNLPGIQPVCNF